MDELEYMSAIADEANRSLRERFPLYDKPIKPWMVQEIEEAKQRLRKLRKCRTKTKKSVLNLTKDGKGSTKSTAEPI